MALEISSDGDSREAALKMDYTATELPNNYKQWCDKCFHKEREDAKTRARALACTL